MNMNSRTAMKISFKLLFSCLLVLITTSCLKERLENLEDKVDMLENSSIASIQEQVNAIGVSVQNLEQTDNELKNYIKLLETTQESFGKALEDVEKKVDLAKKELETAVAGVVSGYEQADEDVSDSMLAQLEMTKADVLAQLDALVASLDAQKTTIENSLSALKVTDVDLQNRLDELKTYVDDELKTSDDWVAATFATLQQHNALVADIAEINSLITSLNSSVKTLEEELDTRIFDALENALAPIKDDLVADVLAEVEDAYMAAISSTRSELENNFTTSMASTIALLEKSMKSWVSEQLLGYKTAVETENEIDALRKEMEGKLYTDMVYLESLISNLDETLSGRIDANNLLITDFKAYFMDEFDGLPKQVSVNAQLIQQNVEGIASNSLEISQNAQLISENAQKIQHLNAQIIALDGEVENEINFLRASIEALIADNAAIILSNSAAILENKESIRQNNELILTVDAYVKGQLASALDKIKDNASAISANASLIQANAEMISNNSKAIAKNTADIIALNDRLVAMKTEISEGYSEAITSAIEDNEGKIMDEVAQLVAGVDKKINQEVKAIGDELQKLNTRVEKCEDDVQTLQQSVLNIQDEILGLKDCISSINLQIVSINTSIPDLEAMDAELSLYIDKLQETADLLESAVEETSLEIKNLEAELENSVSEALSKIDENNASLAANVDAVKADVLGQLAALKQNLENQLKLVNTTLEALLEKDDELDMRIEELTTYVGSQLQNTEDWASATFATLTQYRETVADVTAIRVQIETLQASVENMQAITTDKIVEEIAKTIEPLKNDIIEESLAAIEGTYMDAISQSAASIKEAYTAELNSAVLKLESSLKNWIGEQFKAYYTAEQVDAKLLALKSDFESQLATQKSYLENLISSLSADVHSRDEQNQALIAELRSELSGLSGTVALHAKTIADNANAISENTSTLIRNSEAISVNAAAVELANSKITALQLSMDAEIDALNSRLGEIGSDVDAVNAEIQQVKSNYLSQISALETSVNSLITNNSQSIAANKSAIDKNAALIAANAEAIRKLEGLDCSVQVSLNTQRIAANAEAIAANVSLISSNTLAINNNAAAIADNASEIVKLKSDLAKAVGELTAGYTSAIRESIDKLNGELETEILNQIAAFNGANEAVIGDINASLVELSSRVAACEAEMTAIRETVSDMSTELDMLKTKVDDLLNHIQTITYIPKYDDGCAVLDYLYKRDAVIELDFIVSPRAQVSSIIDSWHDVVSANVVYTGMTQQNGVSMVEVPVLNCTADADTGVLTVQLSGADLSDNVFAATSTANVSVVFSSGQYNYSTSYVKLRPECGAFKDAAFRKYLLDSFDIDKNSIWTEDELQAVTSIRCGNLGITDISGIEHFPNLQQISCSGNDISSIDLTNVQGLMLLYKDAETEVIAGDEYCEYSQNIWQKKLIIDDLIWSVTGYNDLWDTGVATLWQNAKCPEGWRLPSQAEFNSLIANHSKFMGGYWFSGSVPYKEGVPAVFFKADRSYSSGGNYADYWTSNGRQNGTYTSDGYSLRIDEDEIVVRYVTSSGGQYVRCVKDPQ